MNLVAFTVTLFCNLMLKYQGLFNYHTQYKFCWSICVRKHTQKWDRCQRVRRVVYKNVWCEQKVTQECIQYKFCWSICVGKHTQKGDQCQRVRPVVYMYNNVWCEQKVTQEYRFFQKVINISFDNFRKFLKIYRTSQ